MKNEHIPHPRATNSRHRNGKHLRTNVDDVSKRVRLLPNTCCARFNRAKYTQSVTGFTPRACVLWLDTVPETRLVNKLVNK